MDKKPEDQAPESRQSIVQPIVDELKHSQKSRKQQPVETPPPGPLTPPKPAELDQDAGGGYNPDHTIPQP